MLYSVSLTTGTYDLLKEMDTVNKLNGMGFNYSDGYLYAWFYEQQTLARIHADYSIEPLQLQPALNLQYYIGDIAVTDNAQYIYRKNGANGGLWRIALDPVSTDYLQPQQIVTAQELYLNIFDMAFHPSDGFIYSVDNIGRLYRISPANGVASLVANVGQTGTFGAVYFDVDGRLYISRNNDGYIFRIVIDSANPTAEFFSYGPASSNNDGARCALAPVEEPTTPTMDFGDAPATYGTKLSDNGARHIINQALYLGESVDAENRAFLAPSESDDTKDLQDDEDGVQFVTELARGESAVIEVTTVGDGLLSIWLDSNRNGIFEPSEAVIADRAVTTGNPFLSFTVSEAASLGATWMRVRLHNTAGLTAIGLANEGEVEDYPVNINLPSTKTEYYPSSSGVVTLAYEDQWPSRGDYDMNDLIVYYRTSITSDNDEVGLVRQIQVEGEIAAVGAAFHSGFAVSIPGLKTVDVNAADVSLLINGEAPEAIEFGNTVAFMPLQGIPGQLQQDALFEIVRDVWTAVAPGEGCAFHRTENGCGESEAATFILTIPISGEVPASQIGKGVFNPFAFATNGYTRTSIFKDELGAIVPPGDGLEIHLKNHPPSWRGDNELLGRSSDRSIPSSLSTSNPITYQTQAGLPWAIEIAGRWCYPSEYQDLTLAYPDFVTFVASDGQLGADWFRMSNAGNHPQKGEAGYIFQKDNTISSGCAQ
ncbi:LruC domain-containing protein [Halieaceae bacterium IMCC14734]|uniref:LruC domain-containing protein n=1 Tax=Candidatus Litorirhabdus singularis TaxID=2518993 RepID=A0ABT3TL60_9GAMM|nr:LruC domain-containing protein [Candidatus Litorirhabdus singularis]